MGIGKNESGDSRVERSAYPSLRRLKPPATSPATSPAISPIISLRGAGLKQGTAARAAGVSAREGRDWNCWKNIGTNGSAYNEGSRGLRLGFWGIRCLHRKDKGGTPCGGATLTGCKERKNARIKDKLLKNKRTFRVRSISHYRTIVLVCQESLRLGSELRVMKEELSGNQATR
jgi:hypothetical protein